MVRLSRPQKIVGSFAIVGFVLPLLLLAFYSWAHHAGTHPITTALLYLCPMSIASLGLNNSSFVVGFLGWLFISASNACLYAILGLIVALVGELWNRRG
jgi:hypothetical protein